MERDDMQVREQQGPTHDGPLKKPESPDTEAVEEHHDEGSGPFGADMQHMKGGTRNSDPQHEGSPYSTGTNSTTGASTSTADPRSSFAPERTASGTTVEGVHQSDTSKAGVKQDASGPPSPGEHPDIRWDK